MLCITNLVKEINNNKLKKAEPIFNLSAFMSANKIKFIIECLELRGIKAIEIKGVARNRKTYAHEIIYYLIAKKNDFDFTLTNENANLLHEINNIPIKHKNKSLYILENIRASLIKVGISRNVKKRIESIQHTTGCKINKIAEIQTSNAEKLESLILLEFKDYSTFGEWLDIQCKNKLLQYIKELNK